MSERTELSPALIGREKELALLRGKMDQAAGGRGSVVVVSGGAGLGKTLLMVQVGREASAHGMLFLRGAGDSRRPGLAYGLFADVLQAYLANASRAERQDLQGTIAELAPHLWERLFPRKKLPASRAAEMRPDLRQALFLARLSRLLLNLAKRQPVVLCLEDLHWADSASLQVLSFLTGRNREESLLVLGTFRPEEQEEPEQIEMTRVIQDLHRNPHFHLLELAPLSADRTQALIMSRFPRARFSPALLDQLHRKSGGVPLLIVQYLEFLQQRGVLYENHGVWVDRPLDELGIPDSIRAALRQRLQGLGREEREVLTHAAVQGEVFEGRLVARSLGWPPAMVLRLLSRLTRMTRLVQSDGRRFRFAHALLSETFADLLPAARQRQAHLRLAKIMEKDYPQGAEALAYHFYRAAANARALPYLLEAARRARGGYAYREARRFLVQAKEIITGLEDTALRPQRLELLLMLAEVEEKTGDPDRALELCLQVLGLAVPPEDGAAMAHALMQMGWVRYRKREWEEAIKLNEDALGLFAELGEEQKCGVVHVRLGNIAFERSQLDQAAQCYRDAQDVAIKVADYSLLGTIYGNLGVIASVRGQYLEAILRYTEALKAYRKIHHKYGLCQTYHNLGMTHAAQQEWLAALAQYDEGAQLAEEMGTVDVAANILVSGAQAQIGMGDLEGAEDSCLHARFYMEQSGDRLGLAECRKVEGVIYRERARYPEASAQLLSGRHLFEELENQLGVAECDLELGCLLQQRGDVEGARQYLQDSHRVFQEIGALADARKAEDLLAALAS